jgi:hypothetical protein
MSRVNRRGLPEHKRGDATLHGGRLLVPLRPRRQQSSSENRGISNSWRVEMPSAKQKREKTRELRKAHAEKLEDGND